METETNVRILYQPWRNMEINMLARTAFTLSVTLLLAVSARAQAPYNPWNQRLQAPTSANAFAPAAPSSALRPIGAPSLVDQYKARTFAGQPITPSPTPYPVPQTAFQIAPDQNPIGQPQLGSGTIGGFQTQPLQNIPGSSVTPLPVNPNFPNPNFPNPNFPNPNFAQTQPIAPGIAGQQNVAVPVATVGTSNCVSPPSTWTAAGGPFVQTSAVTVTPQRYTPPQTFAPRVAMPNQAPYVNSPNNNGYQPLISLGAPYSNVQVGQGIVGQPTVYVPGQPVRNFFRYLSP